MSTTRYHYAELEDVTVIINGFNATNSSISAALNHNGTPVKGYVTFAADGTPTFTEGDMPEGTASTERELLKKHKFHLWINAEEIANSGAQTYDWVRVKKATEYNREMNAVTEDYDYIADEHPTTEVVDYKPSEDMSVKTIKGEKDFDLFYEFYKGRFTGTKAHRNVLSVFAFDYVDVESE
jgi:hypothetical protein